MTRRPHDALFKAAFEQPEHAAPMLRSILPASVCEAISWDSLRPAPGSFIDPELADSHSDLLFSARLGGYSAYIYLLLEHQSRVDCDMPLRMLKYLVRIGERDREPPFGPLPLIIPAVVSHAPGVSFADMFEPHPSSIPGLAQFVLWVSRDGRDGDEVLRNLERWTAEMRAALAAPNGLEAMGKALRYITLVSRDLQPEDFRAIILEQLPEAEEVVMTIAEQLHQEGLARGLEQGRRRERIELLERLLAAKFGELPPDHRGRIEAASEEQLGRFIDRLLSADAIEAVLADPPRG